MPFPTEKLVDVCREIGLTSDAQRREDPAPEGWMPGTKCWRVVLRLSAGGGRARRITVRFHTGPGIAGTPKTADVVSCVVSDAMLGALAFPGYCSELGASEDSRRAWKAWRSCVRIRKKLLEHLIGPAVFERLARAEH